MPSWSQAANINLDGLFFSLLLTRRMSKKGITKCLAYKLRAVGNVRAQYFLLFLQPFSDKVLRKIVSQSQFSSNYRWSYNYVFTSFSEVVDKELYAMQDSFRFSSFFDHPHTASDRPTPAHGFFTFHCISSSIRLFFPQFMLRCRERKIVELFCSVFFINKIDDLDSSRKLRDNAKRRKQNRLAKITFAAEINCESEVSAPSNRAQISTKRKFLISN